jgi:hypothetical protein
MGSDLRPPRIRGVGQLCDPEVPQAVCLASVGRHTDGTDDAAKPMGRIEQDTPGVLCGPRRGRDKLLSESRCAALPTSSGLRIPVRGYWLKAMQQEQDRNATITPVRPGSIRREDHGMRLQPHPAGSAVEGVADIRETDGLSLTGNAGDRAGREERER